MFNVIFTFYNKLQESENLTRVMEIFKDESCFAVRVTV